MKSVTKRQSSSAVEVIVENTIYEFCLGLGSDGGCLYLTDCHTKITKCFFFHGAARNGGAVCVSGGRLSVSETNFAKNSAKLRAGALLTKDTNVAIMNGRFAGNAAGKSGGAVMMESGSVHCVGSLFYNNSAGMCGGVELKETAGLLMDCYFKGNSAGRKEGIALVVSGNADWMCIEHSKFYDREEFQVSVSAASATRIVGPQFAGDQTSGVLMVDDSKGQMAVVLVPRYGKEMEPAPDLPAGVLREVFAYKETEPPFGWRSLYLLIALFTVVISVMVVFIPIVIVPGEEGLGYRKQEVQTVIQSEEVGFE
jgi:hypothetical protein